MYFFNTLIYIDINLKKLFDNADTFIGILSLVTSGDGKDLLCFSSELAPVDGVFCRLSWG